MRALLACVDPFHRVSTSLRQCVKDLKQKGCIGSDVCLSGLIFALAPGPGMGGAARLLVGEGGAGIHK